MSNFKVSIQKFPKSQIELTCEIPSADFEKYKEEAFLNLSKNLEIKGFRKGSVPKEIARNYISESKILEEAANSAVNDTYFKALEENKIEAISQPEVNIIKAAPGNPFVYKAKMQVMPEVKLPDYKKIAADLNQKFRKSWEEKIKVEEKEIDEAIGWLQRSRAKYITVSREARAGDFVKLKIKNEKLKTGEEEHEGILGSGYFRPDFEKKLIGMREGEEKEFSFGEGEGTVRDLGQGQALNVWARVDLVQEVELPELNDEFAKSLAPLDSKHPTGQGNFENLLSLCQAIAGGLKIEKEEKEKQRWRNELVQEIVKNSQIDPPDVLVEQRLQKMISDLKQNIEDGGLNFEEYLRNLKKTEGSLTSEEDFKKDWRAPAENQVKFALVLREIGAKENIEVSEEEIMEELNKYLKRFPAQKGAEEKVDQKQLKLYYEDVIRNEKTFQFLEIC